MGAQQVQSAASTPKRTPVQDEHYGGNVYLSDHTGTVYQQLVLEEKSLPPIFELIAKRKNLQHSNLVTLRSHFFKQYCSSSFACGQQSKIELYLEYTYLTRTLEDVIEDYNLKGQVIPEKEIKQIFRAVVSVLSFLSKNGTCHGDIKASNILFDHLRSVKLLDSYFISRGKTAYEMILENPSSMSLLAPEQLGRIKHRQNQDLSTIHKSQMFGIGLTMLEAMTFETAMECYNLNQLEVVEGYHDRKKKQLSFTIYSSNLCQLVMRCIEIEIEARPSFEEFLSLLGH